MAFMCTSDFEKRVLEKLKLRYPKCPHMLLAWLNCLPEMVGLGD